MIVSGLARGIDTSAHKGALEAGEQNPEKPDQRLLRVVLIKIYPPKNEELFREIAGIE